MTLKSERLYLRSWQEGDAEPASKRWCDPEIMKYVRLEGPFAANEIEPILMKQNQRGVEACAQIWGIFQAKDDTFVGCAGLNATDSKTAFELVIHILKEHWSKGYAKEIGNALLTHAFETLSAEKVIAGVHPQNHASRKAVEKLGFEFIDQRHWHSKEVAELYYEFRRPHQTLPK